jgi:hypothetical protein
MVRARRHRRRVEDRRGHADDLEHRDEVGLDRRRDRLRVEAGLGDRTGGRRVALGQAEQQMLGLDLLGAQPLRRGQGGEDDVLRLTGEPLKHFHVPLSCRVHAGAWRASCEPPGD